MPYDPYDNLSQEGTQVSDPLPWFAETRLSLTTVFNSINEYKGPALESIAPLMKDGDLMFTEDSKKKKKFKDVHVFLFQRGLVCCKSDGAAFDFKDFVGLTAWTKVVDEQAGKGMFAWCLKTDNKNLWFAAKSRAAKEGWMDVIQSCIDELVRTRQLRPPTIGLDLN